MNDLQKCGFVAVLGLPNAGKSTLVNQLVGQKVSIVSSKVQTTRNKIMGISVFDKSQIILIDTPGIFSAKKHLDRAMVREALTAQENASLVMLVIDSHHFKVEHFAFLKDLLKTDRLLIVLNKIDLVAKPELISIADLIRDLFAYDKIFMISASNGDGVMDLKAYLAEQMPASPWIFVEDEITNVPQSFWAAEITREQIFKYLHQELPYGVFVEPEAWEEFDNGSLKISQAIVVSKDNYKGIILGKQGQMLKLIGQQARQNLIEELGRPVHLKLFVKVESDWQQKSWALKAMGIGVFE